MKRKPIQIAAATDNGCDSVFALCDDGTVWNIITGADNPWVQLPPIPQPVGPKPGYCDLCNEPTDDLIICPEGGEYCQNCFNKGAE